MIKLLASNAAQCGCVCVYDVALRSCASFFVLVLVFHGNLTVFHANRTAFNYT